MNPADVRWWEYSDSRGDLLRLLTDLGLKPKANSRRRKMPCPTCNGTIQNVGTMADKCCRVFWCPYCGTLVAETQSANPAQAPWRDVEAPKGTRVALTSSASLLEQWRGELLGRRDRMKAEREAAAGPTPEMATHDIGGEG